MELYSSCHNGVQSLGCWCRHCDASVYFFTVEWSELGHWCKLGLKFSKLSPLRLLLETLVRVGTEFSESSSLRSLINAYLMTNHKTDDSLNFYPNSILHIVVCI